MLIQLIKENKIAVVASVILLAISIVLEWYGRYCGFNLTDDSLQYLSAAKSFRDGRIFLSPDGSYYSYWPPLFPIIISWWDDAFTALSIINLLCKVLISILLFWLSITFLTRNLYRIVFLIVSMLSVYLTLISVFVWSELLFLTLLLLNTYFTINLRKKNYFYYLLITGFLLCLQRNAGLFCMSGVCVWLILDKENGFLKNLFKSTLVFIISTSGLWAWNIYNTFFLPADFNFYKHSFFQDLFYNVMLIVKTYATMIAPVQNSIIAALVFGSMLILIAYVSKNYWDRKTLLLISITLVYTAGYSAMVKLDVYEMDRYFSVITPIIFLVLIFSIEKLSQRISPKWQLTLIILMVCWLTYPISRTLKNVRFWHERSCLTESSR